MSISEMQKTISENNVIIAQNEQRVYNAGKQAEYDAFWDEFQNNGNRTDYTACFGGACWTAENFKPKYDVYINNAMYTFYHSKMNVDLVDYFEKIGKQVRLDGATTRNLNGTFDTSAFTRVGKIHTTGVNWYYTFNGCSKLVTIDEAGNPAENGETKFQSTTFSGCTALENITIVGWIVNSTSFSSSTKLTEASIRSIITHLSDSASGKTLTLSKTAVNNAFPDPSNNEDWGALIMAHQNWSISLV